MNEIKKLKSKIKKAATKKQSKKEAPRSRDEWF